MAGAAAGHGHMAMDVLGDASQRRAEPDSAVSVLCDSKGERGRGGGALIASHSASLIVRWNAPPDSAPPAFRGFTKLATQVPH